MADAGIVAAEGGNRFYVTTAIDYVNSLPHIGTAYEKIGADALARWHRMRGERVWFQMGNDEHSVNVQKAAIAAGKPVLGICGGMQLLAVLRGGSLHQHLPDDLGVRHEQAPPRDAPAHPSRDG